MALLVNPADRALAQAQTREIVSAARSRGLKLHVLNASNEREFDEVFEELKRLRVDGLVMGAGSVFLGNLNKLAALTVRHAVPTISIYRDFAVAGGLMSYGTEPIGELPIGRRIYRQSSQGRKSRRVACHASDQV